jgi:hypothetical protein
MASINEPPRNDAGVWNQAFDRLRNFLSTFELGDHAHVSQLTLTIFQQARELARQDPARDPIALTLGHAQKNLADWLATNLEEKNKSPSHVLPAGYIAVLLSRVNRTAPNAFLAGPLPEELRQALRETLIVTGPDLNISSMTPRHLDFGPMLQFAQQTWHRWDAKELLIALLFWGGVYTVFYLWLSQVL